MRSFQMLETIPIDGARGNRRWYIDGRQVSFREYYQLGEHSSRQDTFTSCQRGNRWHFRKVAYR